MYDRADKETVRIFTEEPENELWKWILQYSYKANIERHFEEKGISIPEDSVDSVYNSISGAILQGDEYYRACKTASLQIEPLLLYYGSTNLFYALYILKNGSVPNIKNHGMKIRNCDQNPNIADTIIEFNNYADGAVHKFAPLLGFSHNLCNYHDWKLYDFLDSIAEITSDYERCYGKKSNILLLDTIKTPTGTVEKVYLSQSEYSLLQKVEGFTESYLNPQVGNKEGYLVLRHKMMAKPISFNTYSGQTYLQVAHTKDTKNISIPAAMNMYISLFALSTLCRYDPGTWNPFVTQDTSGERLVFEKLLYYSRRMLPNVVLNQIVDKDIAFVSDRYHPEDRIQFVGVHEVQDIVSRKVKEQISKELAQAMIK